MFSNGLFEHADGRIQTKTLPSLAIPSALPIHRIMFRLTAYPISPKQATFIGLFAVCFWSSVIGLIRTLSLHMGAVGGAAVMYSLSTLLLWAIFGLPNLRQFSRSYLFWASIFFVGCELCLSLSIGFADNARQAVEVGMVNYLWPTFTIIGAVWFNKQPAKWWIGIGFVLSFVGIATVLGGDGGFSLPEIIGNVRTNPLSYIMALLDALFWAAYCTLTARTKAQGNAVGLFFFPTFPPPSRGPSRPRRLSSKEP